MKNTTKPKNDGKMYHDKMSYFACEITICGNERDDERTATPINVKIIGTENEINWTQCLIAPRIEKLLFELIPPRVIPNENKRIKEINDTKPLSALFTQKSVLYGINEYMNKTEISKIAGARKKAIFTDLSGTIISLKNNLNEFANIFRLLHTFNLADKFFFFKVKKYIFLHNLPKTQK